LSLLLRHWFVGIIVLLLAQGILAAPPVPETTIDLKRLGYPRKPEASNREFVQHADPQTLNALDMNSRLVAVSPGVMVVYSTRPDEGNKPWSPSSIRAFVIDTASGGLVRRLAWPIRPRTAPGEQVDSEARIFSVQEGRYIVSAHDELALYSETGALVRKLRLGSAFAIQTTPDKGGAVLRSRAASGGALEYAWLDTTTFEVGQRFLHAESYGHPFAFGSLRDSLVFKEVDGLHQVSDGRDRLFCAEAICRDSYGGILTLPGDRSKEQLIAVLSAYGVGVVGLNRGLLWSRTVSQDLGLNHMSFSGITASSDGRRIAFDVMRGGRGRQDFDGLHLDHDHEILVYDSLMGKRISAFTDVAVGGAEDFKFSRDGKTMWTFDGKFLRGFRLPD